MRFGRLAVHDHDRDHGYVYAHTHDHDGALPLFPWREVSRVPKVHTME